MLYVALLCALQNTYPCAVKMKKNRMQRESLALISMNKLHSSPVFQKFKLLLHLSQESMNAKWNSLRTLPNEKQKIIISC